MRPHALQGPRLPYPSPCPWVCLNSHPLSWWCYPTISSCYPFLLQQNKIIGRVTENGKLFLSSMIIANLLHCHFLPTKIFNKDTFVNEAYGSFWRHKSSGPFSEFMSHGKACSLVMFAQNNDYLTFSLLLLPFPTLPMPQLYHVTIPSL